MTARGFGAAAVVRRTTTGAAGVIAWLVTPAPGEVEPTVWVEVAADGRDDVIGAGATAALGDAIDRTAGLGVRSGAATGDGSLPVVSPTLEA